MWISHEIWQSPLLWNNLNVKHILIKMVTKKILSKLFWLPFFFLAISCIPLSIAPKIEGAKVFKGKKFNMPLPSQYVYVFKDPKNADEFYFYINSKFALDYDEMGGNVPVKINGNEYFLTFYEVEKTTKTVNLVPIAVDVAMDYHGYDPLLEDAHITRSGSWYIALTVSDDHFNDILKEDHPARTSVISYLDTLRVEYLSMADYGDLHFMN